MDERDRRRRWTHKIDAGDRRRRWTQEIDERDRRRRWTNEIDAGDGRTRRDEQHNTDETLKGVNGVNMLKGV